MHDRKEAGSGNYHRFCPTSIRQGASRRLIITVIISKLLRNAHIYWRTAKRFEPPAFQNAPCVSQCFAQTGALWKRRSCCSLWALARKGWALPVLGLDGPPVRANSREHRLSCSDPGVGIGGNAIISHLLKWARIVIIPIIISIITRGWKRLQSNNFPFAQPSTTS